MEINEISVYGSVAQSSASGAFKFHCHPKTVAVDESAKWSPNYEISYSITNNIVNNSVYGETCIPDPILRETFKYNSNWNSWIN